MDFCPEAGSLGERTRVTYFFLGLISEEKDPIESRTTSVRTVRLTRFTKVN